MSSTVSRVLNDQAAAAASPRTPMSESAGGPKTWLSPNTIAHALRTGRTSWWGWSFRCGRLYQAGIAGQATFSTPTGTR